MSFARSVGAILVSVTPCALGCSLVAGIHDVVLGDGQEDAATDAPTNGDSPGAPDTDPGFVSGHCAALRGSSDMVRIDVTDQSYSYCIDTHETTVAQYNLFLVADGDPFDAPAQCDDQRSPRKLQNSDPAVQDLAATNLPWCYAWAYCQWVGKRLCREIGGGDPGYNNANSEWRYACSNGKLNFPFSYGPTEDPTACNQSSGSIAKPGAFPACHGTAPPYDGLYDMLGNAGEYDAYFTGDTIRSLGGDFHTAGGCETQGGFSYIGAFDTAGFRCCADP